MAESTPVEKLQPCLLDRLIDDDPLKKEESRNQRVVSSQKYRRGVMRDLEWLFNTSAYLMEGMEDFRLADYREARRSVINYGTRQLTGLIAPNLEELREQLSEAIKIFEPRIIARSMDINSIMERNIVTFEIRGELWANPLPEQLYLKTKVDIETGQCLLGDASNG
jgi:type VI secretion system protein ImpF